MGWLVSLKLPPRNIGNYPGDYFPRRFHYKADAVKVRGMVEAKGGEAILDNYKTLAELARLLNERARR